MTREADRRPILSRPNGSVTMNVVQLYSRHERLYQANRYVYPVLSRRAGGISVGVNLNPDKVCNFDCVYCQVDRQTAGPTRVVDREVLLGELDQMLTLVTSGQLFETEEFQAVPADLRQLRDIAFSGDGEPTTFRRFDELVAACAAVKDRHQLDQVKLVLITNASMFHRSRVQRGLETLSAHQGEIWAKLEAGTEAYYRQVERTTIPFQRILDNITWAARRWPLVIQALFLRIQGAGPTEHEQEEFCRRLSEITSAGGRLLRVQVYTVARPPAEDFVAPLADSEVDAIAQRVRERTGLEVVGYYAGG